MTDEEVVSSTTNIRQWQSGFWCRKQAKIICSGICEKFQINCILCWISQKTLRKSDNLDLLSEIILFRFGDFLVCMSLFCFFLCFRFSCFSVLESQTYSSFPWVIFLWQKLRLTLCFVGFVCFSCVYLQRSSCWFL